MEREDESQEATRRSKPEKGREEEHLFLQNNKLDRENKLEKEKEEGL